MSRGRVPVPASCTGGPGPEGPLRRASPAREGVVGGQAPQRSRLELADGLLGPSELPGGVANRPGRRAAGPEPDPDHRALVLMEVGEGGVDRVLLLALDDLLLEVGLALRPQLAEARLAIADGGVEAGRDPGQVADRLDLVERQLRLLGDLLVGGIAIRVGPQLRLDPVHGPLALGDVGRDTDRTTAVVEAALDRLLDPQHRVGREFVAAAPVELLGGADQPQHRLLDEVLAGEPVALETARELDDETEVGVDQPLLRRQVATLDPLRELDLLLAREQGIAARLVQEELEAVGCFSCFVSAATPGRMQHRMRLGGVLPARTTPVALAFGAPGSGHSSSKYERLASKSIVALRRDFKPPQNTKEQPICPPPTRRRASSPAPSATGSRSR